MRKTWQLGVVLASGMVLCATATSSAQLAVSVGNPLNGGGVYVNTGPGGVTYSSGYAGYAPVYQSGTYTPVYAQPVVTVVQPARRVIVRRPGFHPLRPYRYYW